MADWPLLILLAVDVLAVHRLTRLVTRDVLTTRPRWWIIRRAYQRADRTTSSATDWQAEVEADEVEDPCAVPRLAVLVSCGWCASIWLAAIAVAGHALAPAVWFPLAAVLALSSASVLLGGLED